MRFAYADPPYPGQAKSRYNGREVNHRLLLAYLNEFDGWALSTSAAALREVWNLVPHARCAAWAKTFARNGWSRVRWSWEPVLFVPTRKALKPGERSQDFAWDSFVSAPVIGGWNEVAGQGGGAKPYDFVRWVLNLMGYESGDEFVDVFPGSGSVARAVNFEKVELLQEVLG